MRKTQLSSHTFAWRLPRKSGRSLGEGDTRHSRNPNILAGNYWTVNALNQLLVRVDISRPPKFFPAKNLHHLNYAHLFIASLTRSTNSNLPWPGQPIATFLVPGQPIATFPDPGQPIVTFPDPGQPMATLRKAKHSHARNVWWIVELPPLLRKNCHEIMMR